MDNIIEKLTYDEMKKFLTDPTTRILDARIVENHSSFSRILQVLCTDNIVRELEIAPMHTAPYNEWYEEQLALYHLYYRNSPRMNPALYGLLDAADAESGVEQTAPISAQQPE